MATACASKHIPAHAIHALQTCSSNYFVVTGAAVAHPSIQPRINTGVIELGSLHPSAVPLSMAVCHMPNCTTAVATMLPHSNARDSICKRRTALTVELEMTRAASNGRTAAWPMGKSLQQHPASRYGYEDLACIDDQRRWQCAANWHSRLVCWQSFQWHRKCRLYSGQVRGPALMKMLCSGSPSSSI